MNLSPFLSALPAHYDTTWRYLEAAGIKIL